MTRLGIITNDVRKGLGELSMNLLLPCLMFTQVAKCKIVKPLCCFVSRQETKRIHSVQIVSHSGFLAHYQVIYCDNAKLGSDHPCPNMEKAPWQFVRERNQSWGPMTNIVVVGFKGYCFNLHAKSHNTPTDIASALIMPTFCVLQCLAMQVILSSADLFLWPLVVVSSGYCLGWLAARIMRVPGLRYGCVICWCPLNRMQWTPNLHATYDIDQFPDRYTSKRRSNTVVWSISICAYERNMIWCVILEVSFSKRCAPLFKICSSNFSPSPCLGDFLGPNWFLQLCHVRCKKQAMVNTFGNPVRSKWIQDPVELATLYPQQASFNHRQGLQPTWHRQHIQVPFLNNSAWQGYLLW